ncbi:hypothetical protein PV08_05415 [Exophiala spinifera]|uniref:Kelch repeat protein n=1 Tax=Exophiala spinifera TaxID=91928 RepID=A0A0D2BVP9_9EURO|nr:uncharacterized protein PV08_05415 [Exophiala spinifera]KIW15369.1 hypothetical protein PV08_05415 [Exophiala spinifera]
MLLVLRYASWLLSLAVLASCDYTSKQIASWQRPRASLIRDYVYLEGGKIQTGSWDNQLQMWNTDDVVTTTQGALFNLSLHKPFGANEGDDPAVFQSIPEVAVNNFYVDGFMFASYDEFYAWGGMMLTSLNTRDRTVHDVLYNEPDGKSDADLGVPDTGYDPQNSNFPHGVTNGAGANAPSEKLGFYFGGLYNQNGSKYDYFDQPEDEANFLIKVTMDTIGDSDWGIFTPPDDAKIPWRAEGGLVWIPTSSQGILVALGGVVKPADANNYYHVDNVTTSMTFVKEFPVYDIGSNIWSLQPLSDGSPFPDKPIAQFCTVVASAADYSHHEIFVYGGWDSNNDTTPSSDVWILSIPSFTWIKAASSGREGDPRIGHVCVTPYPDEMIVIGGTGFSESPLTTSRTVDVYNLSTLEWTGSYDPDVHDDYKPNQVVLNAISATPTASGMASDVANWFDTKYDTSKITNFGPYQKPAATTASNGTSTPTPAPHSHHRDWVVPVAVVVSVVGALTLSGFLLFMCFRKRIIERRRRILREREDSIAAGNRKSYILPWIFSTSSAAAPKDVGSDTITEVEPAGSPQVLARGPHEMDSSGGNRNDYFGGSQPRWSSSTAVRSPRADWEGPAEAQDTGIAAIHEVSGSPMSEKPDGINYHFRNMSMYPPSVVSGGHHNIPAAQSATISYADESESVSAATASVSPRSASATNISSPRGVPTIPEDGGTTLDNSGNGTASGPGGAAVLGPLDPVSPLTNKQQRRPLHNRHNSSVSSGVSIPSLGVDQSSPLPSRPRSLSTEEDKGEGEVKGNQTL